MVLGPFAKNQLISDIKFGIRTCASEKLQKPLKKLAPKWIFSWNLEELKWIFSNNSEVSSFFWGIYYFSERLWYRLYNYHQTFIGLVLCKESVTNTVLFCYVFSKSALQIIFKSVFEVQYWSRKWPKKIFLNGIKFFTINLVHMHIFSFLVWLHLF